MAAEGESEAAGPGTECSSEIDFLCFWGVMDDVLDVFTLKLIGNES